MKTKSEWAKALERHLTQEIEPPPDGWKTIKQISIELGKTTCHTSKMINRLVAKGHAERKFYKCVVSIRGQKGPYARTIPHFKLKSKFP
jgi:hypothetical protein